MRKIAHLSDLHFGKVDPEVVHGVGDDVRRIKPDLVVVSGDLTMRARAGQFRAAKEFLEGLGRPLLVVPGNHDVPLYNVAGRFLTPLWAYRRIVSDDTDPFYRDDEIAMLGLNTARSRTWKNGRISHDQIRRIGTAFHGVNGEHTKIIVTHHPFIPPQEGRPPPLVGRVDQALSAFESVGGDLLLSGHLHVGYSREIASFHVRVKRSMIAVHAGTAVSRRHRGQPNAYNVLTVENHRVAIAPRFWGGQRFYAGRVQVYRKVDDHWIARPSRARDEQAVRPQPAPAR